MDKSRSPAGGYILAAVLGAAVGAVATVIVTRAIPVMMSRMMANMMMRMGGEGRDPGEMRGGFVEAHSKSAQAARPEA